MVIYYTAVVRSSVAYGPGTRAAKKAHENNWDVAEIWMLR